MPTVDLDEGHAEAGTGGTTDDDDWLFDRDNGSARRGIPRTWRLTATVDEEPISSSDDASESSGLAVCCGSRGLLATVVDRVREDDGGMAQAGRLRWARPDRCENVCA
jgi:hypothetical protein